MTSDTISAEADARGFLFYTTHVNDPLPAAVAVKVLEIVTRDGLAARAKTLGARLPAGLRDGNQRHACGTDFRGRGLSPAPDSPAPSRHAASALPHTRT